MNRPDNPDASVASQSQPKPQKAVVRRNTEQVQGQGDFALFDELFADDFVDHPPARHYTRQGPGARALQPIA